MTGLLAGTVQVVSAEDAADLDDPQPFISLSVEAISGGTAWTVEVAAPEVVAVQLAQPDGAGVYVLIAGNARNEVQAQSEPAAKVGVDAELLSGAFAVRVPGEVPRTVQLILETLSGEETFVLDTPDGLNGKTIRVDLADQAGSGS